MQSDQTLRRPQHRRNLLERNTGCVGGQHGIRTRMLFKCGKQRPLGLDVFEDRLNDHIRTRDAVASNVRNQSVRGVADPPRIAQAIGEELGGALHRRRKAFCVLVLQRNPQAAQRAPCGDIATHRPGADHMHMRHVEVPLLAQAFEALLQSENADQVGRGWRAQQGRNRCRI